MYNNKMISTNWDKKGCSNGLQAMLLAFKVYENKDKPIYSYEVINEIIKYNLIDCKVMWEILLYLRNNY